MLLFHSTPSSFHPDTHHPGGTGCLFNCSGQNAVWSLSCAFSAGKLIRRSYCSAGHAFKCFCFGACSSTKTLLSPKWRVNSITAAALSWAVTCGCLHLGRGLFVSTVILVWVLAFSRCPLLILMFLGSVMSHPHHRHRRYIP